MRMVPAATAGRSVIARDRRALRRRRPVGSREEGKSVSGMATGKKQSEAAGERGVLRKAKKAAEMSAAGVASLK